MDGTLEEVRAYQRTQPLAVSHNRIGRFGGQVLDERHAIEDAGQFVNEGVHLLRHSGTFRWLNDAFRHTVVALAKFGQTLAIGIAALARAFGEGYECIRHTA